MKKLKLRVEELAVESFEADARTAGRGTVHGHLGAMSDDTLCDILTCGGGYTCDEPEHDRDGVY